MFCLPCTSIHLRNKNKLDALFILSLFRQSTSTCFGLQMCPKHVEVDWRNKLRINSASRWFFLHRGTQIICGNKMPTRCNRCFYCRSYCLLNMFPAPLCPSSGAQEYYAVVAACGMWCCGFQVVGLVWSWGLCVWFAGCWCFGHHYAHHQELKSIIQWLQQHTANRTHNPQLHTRPATWKPKHQIWYLVLWFSSCWSGVWYLVLWFSSCWSGMELRVMCPVCSMLLQPLYNTLELLMMGIVVPETCWASNKICNKNLCCI